MGQFLSNNFMNFNSITITQSNKIRYKSENKLGVTVTKASDI
jgi:hypothetical protein